MRYNVKKGDFLKVLIVDDEVTIADSLSMILEMLLKKDNYNLSFSTVYSGESAIDELKKTTYDLVITDLNLGDLSGVELKQYSNNAILYIVSGEHATDEIEASCDRFIIKPMKAPEVAHLIIEDLFSNAKAA